MIPQNNLENSNKKANFQKEFVTNMMILYFLGAMILAFAITFERAYFVVIVFLMLLYFLSKAGMNRFAARFFLIFAMSFSTMLLDYSNVSFFTLLLNIFLILTIGFTLFDFQFTLVLLTFGLIFTTVSVNVSALEKEIYIISNAYSFTFILTLFLVLNWLASRKSQKSIRELRRSHAVLKKERDLLEKRVEERTKQIYEFAEIGKITVNLLHDIATPLNIVSLNLENLAEEEKNMKNAQIALNRATKGVRTMEKYISETRNRVQKQEKVGFFSPTEEILGVLDALESKASARNISFETQLFCEENLFGSSIQFSQIVGNLLTNAIKAYGNVQRQGSQEEQKPTVSNIIFVRTDCDANEFLLSVKDFGEGIEENKIIDLWEPFTTSETGMGLGMYLTKEIVERSFNGQIFVTTSEGKGTTFSVFIPFIDRYLNNG